MSHDGVCGIVLAAGSGQRFGGHKQFVRVEGQRLIDLAVAATAAACGEVVLVLPPGVVWDGPAVRAVATGGATRNESVRRALAAVPSEAEIVVVHQAANPLAGPALFQAVIAAVRAGAAAAVPGLRPVDVVRRVVDGVIVEDVGRDDLAIVQTPGAFRAEVLRAAHAAGRDALEDTALVADLGVPVKVLPGDPRNIHVTSPEDVELVACMAARHHQAGT